MRVLLPVLMVVLLAAACAQPPLPRDTFYRLDAGSPPTVASSPVLEGILEVERFAADGVLSGRPLVYTEDGAQLLEYSYHFWTEAPTTLLQDQMTRYLRAAGVARQVVSPQMRVIADYMLTGEIKRLERVVGAENQVVVELELGLQRVSDDRILVLQSYSETLPGADTVGGSVAAMNQALANIHARFLAEVGAAR